MQKVLRCAKKFNSTYRDKQRLARFAVYSYLWARECRCRRLATYVDESLRFPRKSAYVAATKKRSGRDCTGCSSKREFPFLFLFLAFLSFLRFYSRVLVFLSPKPKPLLLLARPLFLSRESAHYVVSCRKATP